MSDDKKDEIPEFPDNIPPINPSLSLEVRDNPEKPDLAIFWDYENVRVVAEGKNVPLAESLTTYIKTLGDLRVMKVYSNWTNINPSIVQALYSLGFDPVQVSMGKRNSVDVKLAIDCVDTAILYPTIDCFIIITGDKDFIPLVNWLKLHKKKTIIIGDANIVSEHLILSADDFISLKELSTQEIDEVIVDIEEVAIDSVEERKVYITYENALANLISVIKKNRLEGKSTQLASLDAYMRSNENFDYNGIKNVLAPSGTGVFPNFKTFIDTTERKKSIKSYTIEGFQELFLPHEIPEFESEFSPELLGRIEQSHLPIFYDQILKAFENRKKNKKSATLEYNFLLAFIGNVKHEKKLKYTAQAFRDVIVYFQKIGVIQKLANNKFQLSPNHSQLFKPH